MGKKTKPDRGGTLADILVQRDIRRTKEALREAAIQAELLGA